MSRLRAESSATIDAPPERVYAIIADYRNSHPRILPKENFRDLKVEEGGVGEGTIVTFTSVSGGVKRPYRMKISEPRPGVLVEQDIASSLATTFTVAPLDGGVRSQVTIATEWEASKGFMGLVERLLYPPGMRAIYKKELAQLASVASEGGSVGTT
jgi:hypothetical protein